MGNLSVQYDDLLTEDPTVTSAPLILEGGHESNAVEDTPPTEEEIISAVKRLRSG